MSKFKNLRSKVIALSLDALLKLPNGYSFKGRTTDVNLTLSKAEFKMSKQKTTYYAVDLSGDMIGKMDIYLKPNKKEAIDTYNRYLEALVSGNYKAHYEIILSLETE